MKKLFFSLVAAMMAATASYAQNSLIAVLTHEGEVSAYYGTTALREAHEAAADGDVITLSSGTFNATDITKAVTIRGAGMSADTEAKTTPTILIGDFDIKIPENVEERLTIEGIYHNFNVFFRNTKVNLPTFLKCRLYDVYINSGGGIVNGSFINCNIANTFKIESNFSSVSLANCYVNRPYNWKYENCNFEFVNCVINCDNKIHYSSFTNCILYYNSNGSIESSCNAFYCVGEKSTFGHSIFLALSDNTTNTTLGNNGSTAALFKENTFYELTDDAKAQYIGSDDTEVGIYGGSLPFDARTTAPKITKCHVASKSTADGKLSVDIEVQSAE